MKIKIKNFGFTLVELLVIVAVLIILVALGIPSLRAFQRNSDAAFQAEEIANTLRLAQTKTLASEGASQYGVYFDTSTAPHQYVLFKGQSFTQRATSSDEIHKLPGLIEISAVNLWGQTEVVFEKITGYVPAATSTGEISLRRAAGSVKTIYVENSGQVGTSQPIAFSDEGRLKDSRHIHFSYNREINTTTEKIILSFFGEGLEANFEVPIASNLIDNQIYLEGDFDVLGQIQHLKIHTLKLNSPDSQFCVYRDRRYNNKALTIKIDGDASGSLIDYTAQGQETRGTSVNLTIGEAGDPQRQ